MNLSEPPQEKNTNKVNEYDSSKEPLITVLNAEVENFLHAETRQGWTSWALGAGIGGLIWLLFDELKTNAFDLTTTATIVIVFFTLFDSIRWFAKFLFGFSNQDNAAVRFRWSSEFLSSGRFIFIIEIIRSILIIFTAYYWATSWWLTLIFITTSYVIYIVLMLLAFFSTFGDYAYEDKVSIKAQIWILTYIIFSFVSFCLYLRLIPQPFGDSISNYKLSGLIVVISYLIMVLLIVTKESPILQNLIRIRRMLAFNKLDSAEAIREAEITLYGMQFGDAVMKEINTIFQLVERINQATDTLIFQVNSMHSNLPIVKDKDEVKKAKIEMLVSYRNTCETILRDRQSTLNEMNSEFQSLMSRRSKIESSITNAKDFFFQVDATMNEITKDADEKFAVYLKLADEYDAKLNQIANFQNKTLKK